jgi:hypothetical protein
MDRAAIQNLLRNALSDLIVGEWRLLTLVAGALPASERAIAAELKRHLHRVVPGDWDIDCEYNRRPLNGTPAAKQRGGRYVDLIVHRRGLLHAEHNLLCLELKSAARSAARVDDLRKLRVLMGREACGHDGCSRCKVPYQHGVFLDLRIHGSGATTTISPQWTWVGHDSEGDECERPVFEREGLARLCERGKDGERRRYPVS